MISALVAFTVNSSTKAYNCAGLINYSLQCTVCSSIRGKQDMTTDDPVSLQGVRICSQT